MNLRNTYNSLHPGIKLLIITTLIFVGLLFSQVISGIILYLTSSDIAMDEGCIKSVSVGFLKIIQVINTVFAFFIPAIIISSASNPDPFFYLKLKKSVNYKHIIITFFLIISAIPIINLLAQWNSGFNLPDSMDKIEKVILRMEESAELLTTKMLKTKTAGGLVINILVMAIVPAVCEEVLFRGVIQKTLKDWVKNIHVAIIITGFLFSFVHFQFYGFIPRMFLGVIFGYLLYWTGNLWIPILAHFFNNLFTLIAYYFFYKSDKEIQNPDEMGISGNMLFLWIGLVVFLILFHYFYLVRNKKGK